MIKWGVKLGNERESSLRCFLNNLIEELNRADEYLTPEESLDFRGYYKLYYENPPRDRAFERQIIGFTRGDLGYITSRFFQPQAASPLKILDMGSGQGTHCIYFALTGAEVKGIDLRKERYVIAVKRATFYEKELKIKLKLSFELSNIFHLKERNYYDIIWIGNAISHIHPIEELLRFCYQLLKPGGEIVIVDLNGMHLLNQINLLRERGRNLYTTHKDPNTGEEVVYAIERVFSLPKQISLLRQCNFEIVFRECFIGFHSRANKIFYKWVIKPINKSFILSSVLGKRYVVAARKPE